MLSIPLQAAYFPVIEHCPLSCSVYRCSTHRLLSASNDLCLKIIFENGWSVVCHILHCVFQWSLGHTCGGLYLNFAGTLHKCFLLFFCDCWDHRYTLAEVGRFASSSWEHCIVYRYCIHHSSLLLHFMNYDSEGHRFTLNRVLPSVLACVNMYSL